MTALLPLTNDNLVKYNKNLDNQVTKTGQADEATKDLGSTVTQQVSNIVNNIGNVARSLDTVLGPALKGILGQINDIITAVGRAVGKFNDLLLGAAQVQTATGKFQLFTGFRSEGIETLERVLNGLPVGLIKTQQADRFKDLIKDIQLELAKVGATGTPLDDKLEELQGKAFDLLKTINALDSGTSAPGLPQPPKPPTQTIQDPLNPKAAGGGLLGDRDSAELRRRNAEDLRKGN